MESFLDPSWYYPQEELHALSPLLAEHGHVLMFGYESERRSSDSAEYMRDIGISPLLVGEVLSNPDHP